MSTSCATALAVRRAAPAWNPNWWRRKLRDEKVAPRASQSNDSAVAKKESSSQRLKTGWAGATNSPSPGPRRLFTQPGFDWKAADAYLFDIDGTLLNSRDAVHYHAFHKAVAEVFGLDLKLDGIPVHGNTDVGILRAYLEQAGVPEENWRRQLPQAFDLMCAEVERNAAKLQPELCPAIPELIRILSSQGKLLGVASGNLERVGWAKVSAAGLRDYFSFGAFSGEREKRDDVFAHGIAQARAIRGTHARVCVVGDTPADIRSAQHNHISVIAVATGIYSFDELQGHAPDMCVACCEDLLVQ
ncbi:MAG: HAD family hydrolase [Acidobacteria bacterium]|nr:HAD family hydrolase [Acidobacteriota bacterium]